MLIFPPPNGATRPTTVDGRGFSASPHHARGARSRGRPAPGGLPRSRGPCGDPAVSPRSVSIRWSGEAVSIEAGRSKHGSYSPENRSSEKVNWSWKSRRGEPKDLDNRENRFFGPMSIHPQLDGVQHVRPTVLHIGPSQLSASVPEHDSVHWVGGDHNDSRDSI